MLFKKSKANHTNFYRNPKLFLLQLILTAIVISIFILPTYKFLQEKHKKDIAIFESTKKIIYRSLNLIYFYNNIEKYNLNIYEPEIMQIISDKNTKEIYNIIITDINNQPTLSNLEKDFTNQEALKIIELYSSSKNNYIERINLKGTRNKYGVRNNIGYIYLQRHPRIINERQKSEIHTWSLTAITTLVITAISVWLCNLLFKRFTLKKIILNGESQDTEFKPSFFTNRNIDPNRNFEFECAKVVSSFLNTEGGYLFIGVNDDGDIKGIDYDINYIQQKIITQNNNKINSYKDLEDEYKRKVKGDLSKNINKKAVSSLKLNIIPIESKLFDNSKDSKLLVIKCPPLSQPTFINKRKGSGNELCFRHDTSTIKYSDLRNSLIDNQVFPLWKIIMNNFSFSTYILKTIKWKIKNFIIQI